MPAISKMILSVSILALQVSAREREDFEVFDQGFEPSGSDASYESNDKESSFSGRSVYKYSEGSTSDGSFEDSRMKATFDDMDREFSRPSQQRSRYDDEDEDEDEDNACEECIRDVTKHEIDANVCDHICAPSIDVDGSWESPKKKSSENAFLNNFEAQDAYSSSVALTSSIAIAIGCLMLNAY